MHELLKLLVFFLGHDTSAPIVVYVVSDIHGYYDVFLKGIETIDLKPTDTLYMVGDAIDRGPDGIEILKYIKNHKNMEEDKR